MFDKLKQINHLRSLQSAIQQQRVEVEKQGVHIVMRGDFEIESITLNPDLDIRTQEKAVIQCMKDAKQKIQAMIAKNFAGQLM